MKCDHISRIFKSTNRSLIALLLISSCYLVNGQAQTISLSTLGDRLGDLTALSGTFEQQNVDLLLDRQTVASGRFFFLKPGLMRWIYDRPDPYSIIVGAQQVWIYDPILENVTIHHTRKIKGIKVLSMLFEPGKLDAQFKQTRPEKKLLKTVPGDKSLFLTHKTPDPHISEIQIAFSNTYRIKQFVVVEKNRNYRRIVFTDLNTDSGIKASDFEFKIPVGVEIIDKTKETTYK